MIPAQITYGEFLLFHAHFWAFLAGTALGVAVAAATRRPRGRNVRKAISRKWTASFLWATVAVGALTCGFLVPDELAILTPSSLYVGLYSLSFFFLALRFPRAGGIPAFVVLAGIAFLGPLTVRPFVPARDTAHLADIQLLSATPLRASLEIDDKTPGSGSGPSVREISGTRVVARAYRLTVSDYLFFLGTSTGYALEGVRGVGEENPTEGASPYERMRFVEWAVRALPLLNLDLVASAPVTLPLLRHHSVEGDRSGKLSVVEQSNSE